MDDDDDARGDEVCTVAGGDVVRREVGLLDASTVCC